MAAQPEADTAADIWLCCGSSELQLGVTWGCFPISVLLPGCCSGLSPQAR